MNAFLRIPGVLFAALALAACADPPPPVAARPGDAPRSARPAAAGEEGSTTMTATADSDQPDAYWREKLTPAQYRVAREKGTEAPFSGRYWNTTTPGTYKCAACGQVLFRSDAKFDSNCGWPSYFEPAAPGSVRYERDASHGMDRTEVLCARCGAHLGHVFDDGPPPTGKRFCINSVILQLDPASGPTTGTLPGGKPPAR